MSTNRRALVLIYIQSSKAQIMINQILKKRILINELFYLKYIRESRILDRHLTRKLKLYLHLS